MFNSEILYQSACVASSVISMALAIFLLNTRSMTKEMRHVLPDNLIPYKYLAARRSLGIAYVFIGLMALADVWINVPEHTNACLSGSGLIVGTAQLIIVTSALLSLFNSPVVNRRNILGNICIFMLPPLLYILFWDLPAVRNVIGYACIAICLLQMLAYTFIFFLERRKYHRIMLSRFGREEAKKYSMPGITPLFLTSLLIAIWVSSPVFFPSQGYATVFILFSTVYYSVLAIYFHIQWEHSPAINEITNEEQESDL